MAISETLTTLQRVAAGDQSAVRVFVERYSAALWSLTRKYCADTAEAEDAVQDIFIELWEKADRFDPSVEQYQLWIVDPDVDANPVDGGVFDVTSDGEVIVPIQAKLRVDKPIVFAITVERPGGVVVSKGPLRVVAPVGT